MRGIYLPLGYPDMARFDAAVDAVIANGFEFIEIGIPFSDPVADGAVIRAAQQHVVDSGIRLIDVLPALKRLKKHTIKVYLMTYSNLILSYTPRQFNHDFGDLIDGIILADLPIRMQGYFKSIGLTVPIVPFVTPESRPEDLKAALESDGDFIYLVAIRGITGGQISFSDELKELVTRTKSESDKPVIMGFGIKTHSDALEALEIADGYVVGTEAVKRMEDVAILDQYFKTLLG